MYPSRLAFLLCSFSFFCWSQTITPTVTSPTTNITQPSNQSMFLSVGEVYSRNASNVAALATTLNFGVQIASSSVFSITTLTQQAGSSTASFRSGFGYAVKKSSPLLLIALVDAGTVPPAPGSTAIALGNVGGGLMARYDLGSAWTKLKNVGVSGGLRITAISGNSVTPEYSVAISYFLK